VSNEEQMEPRALRFLRKFTTDAIVSEEQKRFLKKAKWIEWAGSFWCLTDVGRETAEREGYL
jgi:hypothetical protein